jgi:uncharacterized membrane protein YqjE
MAHQAGQPRGRRGTVGHPYSPLNLRLLLASFGLAASLVFAVLAARDDQPVLVMIMAALAVVGVIDLLVVLRRRRQRRREHPDHQYSLFE